jgi:peptidoglycan/xylan/chitin deacetylase (PgdA/CDA1 family)
MTVGSHGCRHQRWRELDDDTLQDDLGVSRRILGEITGMAVTTAACPFGSYDRRVLRALKHAGYTTVYTSDGGTAGAGAWLCPRTSVSKSRTLDAWQSLACGQVPIGRDTITAVKRAVKRWR